jgi:beta-glucanase (GH16 family)
MEIQSPKKTRIEDIEEGYHIYAMDWSKDKIDFLLIII